MPTSRQRLWPASFNHRIEPQPISIDTAQEMTERTNQYSTSVAGPATSGLRRRKGRDPNSTIWKAAEEGDVEEIERQLESGVDVNAYSQPHGTPLSVAAYNGRINVVELLLKKNAEVNGYYYGLRETALHSAAERGYEVIVRSLLKQGADMNAEVCGSTALHVAALKGHWGNVQVFLDFGAGHLHQKVPPCIRVRPGSPPALVSSRSTLLSSNIAIRNFLSNLPLSRTWCFCYGLNRSFDILHHWWYSSQSIMFQWIFEV